MKERKSFLFLHSKVELIISIVVFFHTSHLTTVQDWSQSRTHLPELFLLPSRLEDLSLFLGRLSSLPLSFTRTNQVSSIAPVRLSAGEHLFHLHLELTWAAIQTLCLIVEKQGMWLADLPTTSSCA